MELLWRIVPAARLSRKLQDKRRSALNVSIIIPTLHSPIIDKVIQSLEQQTDRGSIVEIIVVGQIESGTNIAPAQLVPTVQPVAAANARNLGAQRATGDILLFIDSDCLAHPKLVACHLEQHRRGHNVVGGSIAIEPDDTYWRLCDNLLSFTPFLANMPAGERPYLPSCNLSIPRSLFTAAGGFDERFSGAAGEDVDFSFRLRERGYRLFFTPEAQIFHRPSRVSAKTVARHLRSFGQVQVVLHQRYQHLGRSALPKQLSAWTGLLMAAAPLLATIDAVQWYYRYPQLRGYWYCLPGIVWGKSAWYWGYSEMVVMQSRNNNV